MNRLADWIKSHQVAGFLIVTFTISWGLGFTWDVVLNEGVFLLAPLAFVAACGPALAGIIISAVSNTQTSQGRSRTHWVAFLVAWGLSALVFLANNTFINLAPLSPLMIGFTLISVVPVAFVISATYARTPAVRSYLASLIRLRGVWGWSLLALVLIPGLALLSIPISSLLGRGGSADYQLPATGLAFVGLIIVKFLYQLFFFNATGEEVGWRGFALPRMQSLASPLLACLVLNVFWALWHLFPWMAEGRPVFSLEYWAQTYLELLPGTVILSWLYNRGKGSILVASIAHAAANTAFAMFPDLDWTVLNWTVGVAALLMILVDQMWKKLPSDHPAVYRELALDIREQYVWG
jgi:membrane protease YdiL (CAAX protease family)